MGDIIPVLCINSLRCEPAARVQAAAAVDHQPCFDHNKVNDLGCR